ncbi:DNA-binding FadR family transcriptional regulator [Ochrobactrum daejeonense]|uniref:DNA-binding FadR family transcriptional regulator n=1 Tax=Brucella daejeonensis TaxID=659015 RepID=A0A7W9EK07_9HYPH|nr:FadR/GntR family transcriptional regulator [Brucella daejeonensis]MBB5700798.1 DNA-binding FadR family transcriptional regulator [Brucella daejeonensis]NKB79425.1 FadR family transcriptional regulator [Brucella daejeonensis]
MNDFAATAEPRRLYQQIADRIRGLIEGGEFPVGSRLPAERELAHQLGVSRPSLREALIALEIAGSVEVRMGSGVYVSAETERRAVEQAVSFGESPLEIMQARELIEGSVVVMACARMTPEALTELRATLDQMREIVDSGNKAIELDRQFHLLVAEQSGNSVLVRVIRDLFDERHSPLTSQIRTRFEDGDTWALALAEHEMVYAALEARDPLRAQAAMRTHLERSKQRWMDHEPRD